MCSVPVQMSCRESGSSCTEEAGLKRGGRYQHHKYKMNMARGGRPAADCPTVRSWLSARANRNTRCPPTTQQTLEPQKDFLFSVYLTRQRHLEISRSTALPKVKIWFQNRR